MNNKIISKLLIVFLIALSLIGITMFKKSSSNNDKVAKEAVMSTDTKSEDTKEIAKKEEKTASDLENYEAALKNGLPTMVEFKTSTCHVCKEMQPVMEEVKKDFADSGKANVIIINLDNPENHKLASDFQIRYVPTMIFLDKDTKVTDAVAGYMDKDKIAEMFKAAGVL